LKQTLSILLLAWTTLVWGDTNEIVTLKVFGNALSPSVSLSAQPATQRVIHRFQQLHPNIRLTTGEGLRIQGAASDAGPLMAIAADIAPDVFYVNFRNSDSYIQQGFLHPLDDFIKEMPADELALRVPEQAWPVIRRIGPDGKEHVYAVPFDTFVVTLQFRRDMFKAAGLDPNQSTRNWPELAEYCRKIHAADKTKYGMAFDTVNEAWKFSSFLWSAGGDPMTEIAPGQWRATFDSPAAVEALAFYYRLVKSGDVYRGTDAADIWKRGRSAMIFDYVGNSLMFALDQDPLRYGVVPVPFGPTGLRGNEINCQMMGIYAGVKDPRKLRAAWEFIRFYDSPEARAIRTRAFVENGLSAQVNAKALKAYGFEEYIVDAPPEWTATREEALKSGKPEPYGRNSNLIYKEMSRPMDQMFYDARLEECWKAGDDAGLKQRIQEIFTEAVKRTNERLIGYVPPATVKFRLRVAAVVVAVVLVAFVFLFRSIWKIFTPAIRGERKANWDFRRHWIAYAILLPALLTILIWQYVPLMRGSAMAFQDFRIMGGSKWVGLDNFAQLLFDQGFWNALWVTVQFTFWSLSLGFFAPVFLAILLQEVPRGKVLYRVIYYLPHMVSGLIVVFLWRTFYAGDGLFNQLLGLVGLNKNVNWLAHPSSALIACILPGIWAGMGTGCLIYLAALKSIPDELYEASDLDGASFLHKIQHIVIPSLKPLLIINFIGAFAGSFHSSANILVMTGGGPYTPYGATEVTSLLIYYNAFLYLRFGLATAMAWTLGAMLIGFTVIQLKRLSRMEFRTTEAK